MLNNQQPNHLLEEKNNLPQHIAEVAESNREHPESIDTLLFENSCGPILIIDPNSMNILDANPSALRSLGYGRTEICQLKINEIEVNCYQNMNLAESLWGSYLNVTDSYECQYRHKGGRLIAMEVNSHIAHRDGRHVVVNFVRAMSENQADDLALPESNQSFKQPISEMHDSLVMKLSAEKEKLEAALGTTSEGIVLTNTDFGIVYANPSFIKMMGYCLDEAESSHALTLFEFFQHDAQQRDYALQKGRSWSGEVKGIRKDGSTFPTILTIEQMLAANGRPKGFAISQRDIGRFKALENAQDKFITNVSHQLRTPLANIKLYTQLLEGNVKNDEAVKYLNVLTTQTNRLEHLVEDILKLASLETLDNEVDWVPVDLAKFLTRKFETNQKCALEQDLTLTYKITEDIPLFLGNWDQLSQAFNEIIENALIYTPSGGCIDIDVTHEKDNNRQWIAVKIEDNGPGIAFKEQSKIFERFFRGQLVDHGNITGTGLGLSIAQQIINAHHGQIALQSSLGQGSVFTVWLPIDTVG